MRIAIWPRVASCAVLMLAVRAVAQDVRTPAGHTRTPAATPTPAALTPTPTPGAEAPPPDAGLMKTPRASSGLPSRPVQPGDCAAGGWRGYSNPRFEDRKSCEGWLRDHPFFEQSPPPPPEPGPGAGGLSLRTSAPVRA